MSNAGSTFPTSVPTWWVTAYGHLCIRELLERSDAAHSQDLAPERASGSPMARSLLSRRRHELKPVAHAVEGVEPSEAGEVAVPDDLHALVFQSSGQCVEVGDENAGMRLAGRAKVLLHT
jgi:hypothetical protein